MKKPIREMSLEELCQYQDWLYRKIEDLRYQKRIAKYDSKWFQQAGIQVLHIEDELKKLEKIRKEVLKQIEQKRRFQR